MDVRKINAMAFVPLSMMLPVWNMIESHLKGRNTKAMPIFEHFDKYLMRGYTNASGVLIPPKWGPEMWSVYGKVLEGRTRTTDKLEAWHRRLQAIICRPHPDMDTFIKTLCEEWIFIKTNIKKRLAKLPVFEVSKKSLLEREERIKRVVFNMATFRGPIEYLEAIARATKC